MPPVIKAAQAIAPVVPLPAYKQHSVNIALMRAVEDKLPLSVEEAVAAGANVNVKDNEGRTPLMNAVQNGDVDTVRKLKALGADLTITHADSGYTALMMVANVALKNNRDDQMAEILLEGDPDVSYVDYADAVNGETALMIAMDAAKDKIARKLIRVGADVNKLNAQGDSMLTYAAKSNDTSTIKVLLQNKNVIPVNEVWRAADLAFKNGHIPMFVNLWHQAINNSRNFIEIGEPSVIPDAVRQITGNQEPERSSQNANMEMMIANNPGPDTAQAAPRTLIYTTRAAPAHAAVGSVPSAAVKRPAPFTLSDEEARPPTRAHNPTDTTRKDDAAYRNVQLPSP